MKKLMVIMLLICSFPGVYAHLCNDVFVQARDNLAIKVDIRDGQLRIGKQASFRVYLLNTMDRDIAKIKMEVDTDAFNTTVTPSSDWHNHPRLKTVKSGGKKQFFEVSLERKSGTPDGKYKIGLRLFYGNQEFKTVDLEEAADILAVPYVEKITIDGSMSKSEWGTSLLASSFHERKKVGRYMENRVSDIQSRLRFSCDGKRLYCSYAFQNGSGSGISTDRACIYLASSHESDPVCINIDRTKGMVSCDSDRVKPDFKFSQDSSTVEAAIPLSALNITGGKNLFVNASRETSLKNGKKVRTYWRGNEMSVTNPIIFSNLQIPEPKKRATPVKKADKKTSSEPAGDEAKAEALLQTAIKMKNEGLGNWNVANLLKRIVKKYPDTKAAKQAQKMLKEMQ